MYDKRTHIRCDWSPDIWSWSPLEGRWSPVHGRPRDAVHLEVSTNDAGYREGYDFWRETVFYAFDADRQPEHGSKGFRADVSGLISEIGEFYTYRSDAMSGGRTRQQINADDCRDIDLGLVLAGERRYSDASGTNGITRDGGFYLYDAAQPSRVQWEAHEGIHMTLRREAVENVLGKPLPPVDQIAGLLDSSRMGATLKRQLSFMADHIGALSANERTFLLEQAVELALFSLGRVRGLVDPSQEETQAGLYVAARRVIEAHYADKNLTPSSVALLLGVSRASLYRAFSGHKHSVSDVICDIRLERAKTMLKLARQLPLDEVALRCGFTHVRSFQRVFRKRFGVSPSEAREV